MIFECRQVAPAKINLGLRVLPKREDGFHNIESIFQTVAIYDELLVRRTDGFGKCCVFCDSFNLPPKNTITKAYEAFKNILSDLNKHTFPVDVELTKNIPSGAGLGGGSSDAAFFIRSLEKLHDVCLTDEQLDKIASVVGSDVFFFLHSDCALVSGRGEMVQSIEKRHDLHFLLVFLPIHSSTLEAYSLVDDWMKKNEFIAPDFNDLESIYNLPVKEWSFKNTFTIPLSKKYTGIGEALNALKMSGADFFDMTGSGSCVFGVYESKKDAESAKKIMDLKGFENTIV